MYAYIRGTVAEKGTDYCVLDCGGVGYRIITTRSALSRLPDRGQEGFLYVQLYVREDDRLLLGFATQEEKRMYQRLITVSGIGQKVAMALLSGLSAQELALALATRDDKTLSSVPGVGKKTAQRMILELNEQAAREFTHQTLPTQAAGDSQGASAIQEAAEVLITLGYRPAEAATAAAGAAQPGMPVEEIVKAALSAMDRARSGQD